MSKKPKGSLTVFSTTNGYPVDAVCVSFLCQRVKERYKYKSLNPDRSLVISTKKIGAITFSHPLAL